MSLELCENTRDPLIDSEKLDKHQTGKRFVNIDPCSIIGFPKIDFSISSMDERVADGDWDLDVIPMHDTLAYRFFSDIFVNNKSQEETDLYNGSHQAGIRNIKEIEKMSAKERIVWKDIRCKYLRYLFTCMRDVGYCQNPFAEFVSILIGRNGEAILNNGRHRIAAAQVIGFNEWPVLVDICHKEWIDFKQSIVDYTEKHDNKVYAPLKHFDLKDVPSRQVDRSSVVFDAVRPDTKTLVDLGANWGCMCKEAEERGITAVAVESDDVEFGFLERLKVIYGCSYETCKMDVCDFIMDRSKFDCVLALSILHHLAKTEDGHDRMLSLLRRLDCKQMIFQMPLASEMSMFTNSYRNYTSDEFCKIIINNSCLTHVKEIGDFNERKMFCFDLGDYNGDKSNNEF